MNATRVFEEPSPTTTRPISFFFTLNHIYMHNIINSNRQPWYSFHRMHWQNSGVLARPFMEAFGFGDDGQPPAAVQTTMSNNLRLHHCVYHLSTQWEMCSLNVLVPLTHVYYISSSDHYVVSLCNSNHVNNTFTIGESHWCQRWACCTQHNYTY